MFIRIALLVIGTAFSGSAFALSEPSAVVEAAPLQGVLGQISVRGERVWQNSVSMAAQFESRKASGERADRKDSWQRLSVEALRYPRLWGLDGLYLSAGLDYELARLSRQRDRDYISTIRYTEDERFDLWMNENHHLLAHVGVGYRFFVGKYATASLRYVHESLLYTHAEVRRETIHSLNPDLSTPDRPRQVGQVTMLVGWSVD